MFVDIVKKPGLSKKYYLIIENVFDIDDEHRTMYLALGLMMAQHW